MTTIRYLAHRTGMRILLFGALFAVACKGGSSGSSTTGKSGDARAFLPAEPELAVRVEVDRARAWPGFGKVAPILLTDLQPLLDELKASCNLDVVADAKRVVVASKGPDVAIVIGGLAKDRVHACAKPDKSLRLDGDLLSVHRASKAVASGKFLGSGDLVLLGQNGGALDAAAWKVAQDKATVVAPWVATLEGAVATAWIVTKDRKVLAKSDLGQPLLVKASSATDSLQAAKRDQQLIFATGEFFSKANAGTIATAITGNSVDATLTVQPHQLDALIGLVSPLLSGGSLVSSKPPDPTTPTDDGSGSATAEPQIPLDPKIVVDCFGLKDSIKKYLDASVKSAPPSSRAQMQKLATQLQPEMEKIFSQRCVTDQWPTEAIRCHIATAHAGMVIRFEKCKLSTTQRANLDKDLKDAMAKVGVAPITKETVEKEAAGRGSAGSGSAGSAATP